MPDLSDLAFDRVAADMAVTLIERAKWDAFDKVSKVEDYLIWQDSIFTYFL